MKALQVEKEKILHEMFVEDLDKKKNDIIDNKQEQKYLYFIYFVV